MVCGFPINHGTPTQDGDGGLRFRASLWAERGFKMHQIVEIGKSPMCM